MSRNTGTFNFAANFEGLLKAPIDARQMVGTYADLTLPGTWNASGQVWLYNGAIVAVGSDPTPSNNGVYWLCDANNYTMSCAWLKAGSGSGAGTITGATNGLSTGATNIIKLGGTLCETTDISGAQDLTFGGVIPLANFAVSASSDIEFQIPNNQVTLDLQVGGTGLFRGKSITLSSSANTAVVNVSGSTVRIGTISGVTPSQGITIGSFSGTCVYDTFYQRGLYYTGNYWLNNQNHERWIPDKGYVDGIVTTGASVIGGFNGVGLLNRCICLGGRLLNDTIINASGNTLCVNNGYLSTERGYQISGVTILRTDPSDINSVYIGDNANFNISGTDNIGIGSWSLKSTTTGSNNLAIGAASLSAITTSSGNVAIGYHAGMHETGSNKLIIANNANTCLISGDFSTSGLTFNANLCIGKIPATGASTDGFLVWNSGTKCVQQVDVGSIIANSITGATNGLTKYGQTVVLGGDLTSGTTITLCDNALRLRSDSANAYGLADFNLNSTYGNSKFGICSRDTINGIWGLSGNSTSISAYHCADGTCGSCLNISNNGLSISSKGGADKSVTFNASGFSYAGNYCSSNISNPRWIPDKNYIDKQISGCSNILKVRIQGLSAPFTMSANDDIVAVSGLTYGQELCLPSSPQCGQRITVVDVCGTALTCPIIINGLGKVINGGTCSTINTDYGSVTFVYIGYNYWSAIAFVN